MRLRRNWRRAPETDAPTRALEIIRGWVGQLGPCDPGDHLERVTDAIQRIAKRYDLEETPPREDLLRIWSNDRERYGKIRRKYHRGSKDVVRRRCTGTGGSL